VNQFIACSMLYAIATGQIITTQNVVRQWPPLVYRIVLSVDLHDRPSGTHKYLVNTRTRLHARVIYERAYFRQYGVHGPSFHCRLWTDMSMLRTGLPRQEVWLFLQTSGKRSLVTNKAVSWLNTDYRLSNLRTTLNGYFFRVLCHTARYLCLYFRIRCT